MQQTSSSRPPLTGAGDGDSSNRGQTKGKVEGNPSQQQPLLPIDMNTLELMIGKAVENAVSSAVEKQLALALKENVPPPTSPNLSMQGVKKKEKKKKKTETAPVSPPPACAAHQNDACSLDLTGAALQQLSSALQMQISAGQQQFPMSPNRFYPPPSSPPYPNPYSPSGAPLFYHPNYAPSGPPPMPPYTPPGWHY